MVSESPAARRVPSLPGSGFPVLTLPGGSISHWALSLWASRSTHCSLTIAVAKLCRLQSASARLSHLTLREHCELRINTPILGYEHPNFAVEESAALSAG